MLSIQAFRNGSFQKLIRFSTGERVAAIIQCRTSSSTTSSTPPPAGTTPGTPASTPASTTPGTPDKVREKEEMVPMENSMAKDVETWRAAKKYFFGPERDYVNFPNPQITEPVKVRYGFVPDEWFEYYYKKGGVSGEYLLFWGGLTALLSKQWLVVDHTFMEALAAGSAIYLVHRKFGARIAAYLDKVSDNTEKEIFTKPISAQKEVAMKKKKSAEDDIWRMEGLPILYQLKRENIDLQLEAEYRKRLNQVHKTVKQQLDYRVDVGLAKRRLEQEHMVNWITSSVEKSITPQLEKDSIASCIQNLKRLSTSTAL